MKSILDLTDEERLEYLAFLVHHKGATVRQLGLYLQLVARMR